MQVKRAATSASPPAFKVNYSIGNDFPGFHIVFVKFSCSNELLNAKVLYREYKNLLFLFFFHNS